MTEKQFHELSLLLNSHYAGHRLAERVNRQREIRAYVERLELKATISEHQELCDDCGFSMTTSGSVFHPCDRRVELDDKLAEVKK